MAALLEDNSRLAAKDTRYRCHDLLMDHSKNLFSHLLERRAGLFNATFDILLYDLTSSYFEVDANGGIAQSRELKAAGYSRDKRPDCLPIAIALIVTPDGLPIAYEVMRQKKLKAYWARLKEPRNRATLGRDELLPAIGAAKQKAGRNAHRPVTLHLPGTTSPVGKDTFRFELDRKKLRRTRLGEGRYLLRSNLTGEDPAALWQNYTNLVGIEESFRTLKGDLGLRPVHHPLDGRIKAHSFISFLARFAEIQMLNVRIPTTDGREIHMKRHTKPEKLHHLLLNQLGLTLPALPPPEIKAQDIPVA